MRPIKACSPWVGGLIAPLAAPIVFFCVVLVIAIFKNGLAAGMHDWKQGLGLITLFTLPVSYLATWILGFPYIHWLRATSRFSKGNVIIGAMGIGVISAWTFQLIGSAGTISVPRLALGAVIGAALSFCVAVTFCWIVRGSLEKKMLGTI